MTTTSTSPTTTGPTLARRFATWLLLYAFGLSVSTLLVGVWGQAVSGDEEALATGVRAAVATELVAERMETWLAGAADGVPEAETGAILQRVAATPEVASAVDVLVEAIVDGAVAEPRRAATVDVAAALAPVGRVLAEELAASGVAVSPEETTAALSGLEPIVLDASTQVAGVARTARGVLTVAALAATGVAAVTGGLSVFLSDDRIRMARTLLFRLAVGAMTFVLFARIGAWALDPGGGRSPVAAGGAALLRSHTGILLAIMATGALAGSGLGVYAARRRRTGDVAVVGTDDGEDEPTAERVLITV
jgi:hypothetical protein